MAPRSEEQNKVIRDERREELLTHAMFVFAKKGYAAAKVSDITQSASLSPGIIYHYFESKEDLFVAALSQLIEVTNNNLKQIAALDCEPTEKMRILTRQYIESDCTYRWRFVLQACLSESMIQRARDILVHNFFGIKYVKSIIEEGQKKEQFSTDMNAEALTLAYWSFMKGFALYKDLKSNDSNSTFTIPDVENILKLLNGGCTI